MGFPFNEIDILYIMEIISVNSSDWRFYYHCEGEVEF